MKCFLISVFFLICISCSTKSEISDNPVEIKKNEKVISLKILQTEYTLKVGEQCQYVASIHGSVGNQVNVDVSDETVLKTVSEIFKYNKDYGEDERRPSGGDAAKRTYLFEAVKVGKATITIEKEFRGDVESTHAIEISVTE